MLSRPKPTETEEDLLRLQEEFNKNKHATQQGNVIPEEIQKDLNVANGCKPETTIDDQLANTFETVPILSLGAIRENHEGVDKIEVGLVNVPKTGFPKAQKLGEASRFGRERKEMQGDALSKATPSTVAKSQPETMQAGPSNLSQMKQEVHAQNANVLASMTPEEIKEEQEKYMSSLDPALIAYIKSRKKAASEENQPQVEPAKADKSSQTQSEDVELNEIEATMQMVGEAADHQWIGFDKIELAKMSWMKDVEIRKSIKNKEYEARFDFQGWLMPYKYDEMNESTRALYHHGEDADRPGYTLQELFQLSRSTVNQQRVIALNCIANILRIHSLGVYKDIIDLPIEQIFFVVRFSLDSNAPAVLSGSIKAMRNLIYCYTDEAGLDMTILYGLGKVQPIISVQDKEEDDYTENDQQVIEKNFIKCLVRANILNRIRYILDTVRPPLEDARHCLEILIRLARDSKVIYEKIIRCEGLLMSIIKNHLSRNWKQFKRVLPEAFKLLRVLMSRDKQFASGVVRKYHITESAERYLSDEQFYSNGDVLKILIECLNMWSVLMRYGIDCNLYRRLSPVFLRNFNYYLICLDADEQRPLLVLDHFGAFLNFISEALTVDHVDNRAYMKLVFACLRKWTYKVVERDNSDWIVLTGLYNCVANYYNASHNTETVKKVIKWILLILKSQQFDAATKKIVANSMLLNECEINTSSSNLRTLETGAWNSRQHAIPILRVGDCLPFLVALSNLMLVTKSQEAMVDFLEHENLKRYIKALLKSDKFYNINNWFTDIESSLIINLLKIAKSIENFSGWTDMYSLAVKILPAFDTRHKQDVLFIFTNIIFSVPILKKVVVSGDSLIPEDMLNSTKDMLKVYTDILNLDKTTSNFRTTLSLDVKIGNIIPVDWLYSPLVALYSQNQESNKISENTQLYQLKNCLKWILFSENFLPPISDAVGVTEKYCRLACVFLAHDSLFLEPDVHDVLQKLLQSLMPFSDKIDLGEQIEGVANFEDFYKLLLEQYQGVSYGDALFANVILAPLAQRHDMKWRKILWSEYLGTVQALCITPEQLMFDLATLLEPPEDDKSLIFCYKKALGTNVLRTNSLLFKVASHHVQSFEERNKTP